MDRHLRHVLGLRRRTPRNVLQASSGFERAVDQRPGAAEIPVYECLPSSRPGKSVLLLGTCNTTLRGISVPANFFRTMLFKIFNRIDTWEALEHSLGPLVWDPGCVERIDGLLSRALRQGRSIYSPAYIIPAPCLGHPRKHTNHLALLAQMMDDRLPERVHAATSLEAVYRALRSYPGLGSFLAFQYTIDLNYSEMLDFDERSFVVAGPGARDGISKCFLELDRSPEEVIHWVADRQEREFAERGLVFPGLFGRQLQPIDCQNLFCEISKYRESRPPRHSGNCKPPTDQAGLSTGYTSRSEPVLPSSVGLTGWTTKRERGGSRAAAQLCRSLMASIVNAAGECAQIALAPEPHD